MGKDKAKDKVKDKAKTVPAADVKTRSVLIVDDDPDVRTSVSLLIKAAGCRPLCASTCADGIAVFLREKPQLVLADLMMETVDAGIDLVKRIKAAATVPVYILSSVGDSLGDTIGLDRIGADGVLQKPLAPELLRRLLADRLG
jgi:DNA-binding response OmpR family regulator